MRNDSNEVLEKVKTHILWAVTFFGSKIMSFMRHVEEYGRSRQAADDNITRRMHIACWITWATNTRSKYATIIAFFMVTIVTRTRLNITLYVHRLLACRLILLNPAKCSTQGPKCINHE